ncbi:MAG: dihydropteroate synthase [Pseudomonadota bacterium]
MTSPLSRPSANAAGADARAAGARRFAGFVLDRSLIMGVVNVTPDSFSDGGDHADPGAAISHGLSLLAEGADILDVGGESTRPGALPVPPEVELQRAIPVVAALDQAGAVVSIDTRRPEVMRAALAAGARIVNDITALQDHAESLDMVARSGAAVVLMHMQGEPRTMQVDPRYDDAPAEIEAFLRERVMACRAAGMSLERIAVDPGIGFGKTVEHNLELLRALPRLKRLGAAVAIGVSRKGFIGALSRGEPPTGRAAGSLAAGLAAVARGADILRVHDVAMTVQALAVWRAIGAPPALST